MKAGLLFCALVLLPSCSNIDAFEEAVFNGQPDDPSPDGGVNNTVCGEGQALCDGFCVDTLGSVNHCGGCAPCRPGPNSVPSCDQGECVFACEGGFADTNDDAQLGSESDGCDCPVFGEERCNGEDDDCDGEVDEGVTNVCGGCRAIEGTQGEACGVDDCMGQLECDGLDRLVCVGELVNVCGGCEVLDDEIGSPCGECGQLECDGEGGLGCIERKTRFFRDADQDGFGLADDSQDLCASEGQYTATRPGDCDDESDGIFPGATEVCDGEDNNCDTEIDEGVRNTCGGCVPLEGDQGDDCGVDDCPGQLECDGLDRLICAGDLVNACGGCGTLNGERGEACGECGERVCADEDTLRCDEQPRLFYRDEDGDGFGVDDDMITACAPQAPHTATRGGDCNDDLPDINPDADEVCDGVDDDCDNQIDDGVANACGGCGPPLPGSPGGPCRDCGVFRCEGGALVCDEVLSTFFQDTDDDGFGVSGLTQALCGPQDPFTATVGGDCDDDNPEAFPGGVEVCDGADNNCNEETDEGVANACGGCAVLEGSPDDDCLDCGTLVCDGLDALRCDEDLSEFFRDRDGDTYGFTPVAPRLLCGPVGFFRATRAGDCDDEQADINPDAIEICDGADNDCNGETDADDDDLMPVSCALQQGVCASTEAVCDEGASLECDDLDYDRQIPSDLFEPLLELSCDQEDNDCDGLTDENCCDSPADARLALTAALDPQAQQVVPSVAVSPDGEHISIAWMEMEGEFNEYRIPNDTQVRIARVNRQGQTAFAPVTLMSPPIRAFPMFASHAQGLDLAYLYLSEPSVLIRHRLAHDWTELPELIETVARNVGLFTMGMARQTGLGGFVWNTFGQRPNQLEFRGVHDNGLLASNQLTIEEGQFTQMHLVSSGSAMLVAALGALNLGDLNTIVFGGISNAFQLEQDGLHRLVLSGVGDWLAATHKPSGGFLVAFSRTVEGTEHLFFQPTFDDGAPNGEPRNVHTPDASISAASLIAVDGGVVLVWTEGVDNGGSTTYFRRFDGDGSPIGDVVPLVNQVRPTLHPLALARGPESFDARAQWFAWASSDAPLINDGQLPGTIKLGMIRTNGDLICFGE